MTRNAGLDSKRKTLAGLVTAWLLVGMVGVPLIAEEPAAYRKVLDQAAKSVVTVRFLLHAEVGGGLGSSVEELPEMEAEINGLLIDPGGLVVCSNRRLGGMLDLIREFAGSIAADIEIVATPRDIEVLLDTGEEALPARVVARDSDLDLAWIQIDNPDGRTFPAVDLAAGGSARVGDPVLVVWRVDKTFGRVAVLEETRIGGAVAKPRPLLLPTVPITGFGLPAFDFEGRLVGFTVIQLPDAGVDLTSNPIAAMTRVFELEQSFSGLVMPVSELARATDLAREMAAEMEPAESTPAETTPAETSSEEPSAETPGSGDEAGGEESSGEEGDLEAVLAG